MGILKNVVKNAVNDGIRKGVGQAVGKAVEKAVAPAAERWANKSAEAIDSAAAEIDKGIAETQAAAGETGGFASLESSLAGLASRAEKYATKMSASMKICPSCGEASQADKVFCPHCGAKLPETTLGQDYTCSKCGEANTPGTKYCSKCGAILPAAEAEIKAQQAKDAEMLAKFEATLPQYPKWTVGGTEFTFEDYGTNNGYPTYQLYFTGSRKELDAYVALLKQEGFAQSGSEFWKQIDGLSRTACPNSIDENTVSFTFYVSNLGKKAESKPSNPLSDLKKDLNDLKDIKGAAKGIFKKFMGN